MKISIILGTRPEIIKMSPLIRECEKRDLEYFVLHSGQHYSYNLDEVFFEELELPRVAYNLEVGSGSHGEEIGKMLVGIETILLKESPDIVLVQGDTNTVLAGALAASRLHIRIGHVEAGLRSYDRNMPEEINRVLTDHISDYLFAPTEGSRGYLLREGINEERIFVVGNTIVDSVVQNLKIAERKSKILIDSNLSSKKYMILTSHRQENVDAKDRFKEILKGIEKIVHEYDIPVVYPIHPRSKKRLEEFGLRVPDGLKLIEPLGYLDFLWLEANASLILTDSGGVQEESCIMKVPCVTLRDNTERPETLEAGSNILVGADSKKILYGASTMLSRSKKWTNPFGDGSSAEQIINILHKIYNGE